MTYSDHDRQRWAPEPAKSPGRGDFARDRARVVHSASLRRLAAKTQVVGPGTDDFVRNRLTHSLEVAQVGRELGAALGCDPDVVDAACLAHDLGHPPFGHNGERELDEVAAAAGGFEGNAQTLRLLTRLEPKRAHDDGRPAGLNLTRASLDASVKYPWPRSGAAPAAGAHGDGSPVTVVKFGVYPDDREVFDWLRHGSGPTDRQRCVEAQVMDWADDVAYSVHDVEDGVVSGDVPLHLLRDSDAAEQIAAVAGRLYAPDADVAELRAVVSALAARPPVQAAMAVVADASGAGCGLDRRGLSVLKDMTSHLVGRFTRAAEDATRRRYGQGDLVRYGADLVVPQRIRWECAVMKGVAAHYLMQGDTREAIQVRQREQVRELCVALLKRAPQGLDPSFAADHRAAAGDRERLRVVVDQVASLTDASAVALWRRWVVDEARGTS